MMGTPIINPPQSAILGMHGITKRPVVVGNQVCDCCLNRINKLSSKRQGASGRAVAAVVAAAERESM
jgi:hypothetical protein